jgi:hypothetical protein
MPTPEEKEIEVKKIKKGRKKKKRRKGKKERKKEKKNKERKKERKKKEKKKEKKERRKRKEKKKERKKEKKEKDVKRSIPEAVQEKEDNPISNFFAKPMSVIFTLPSLSSKIFCGLISLQYQNRNKANTKPKMERNKKRKNN